MTEQSPADRINRASNDIFDATSFLSGTNAAFLEALYEQYLANPASVDPAWQAYFQGLGEQGLSPTQLGRGPAWRRDSKPGIPADDITGALSGQTAPLPKPAKAGKGAPAAASGENARAVAQDSIRAVQLVRAYRIIGHLEADLDPLGITPRQPHPQLDPAFYGFHDAEMDKPIFIDGVMGVESASPRQIVDLLKRTYCGRIGYEFMHITDAEQKDWLQRRIEGPDKDISFTPEGKKAILNKLIEGEGFEKFAAARFVGAKRFGLDGGEATIPALEQIIKRGGQLGVKEIVLGMAHR
ncbi:MAG: 2-oxoglutarate dehydrogenase E1 component, partial [Alphaproteobacteria bacterium]|nr:2-oxoglutarate dehydrogenase E1 component [Alphaproteobacteria bacterium]